MTASSVPLLKFPSVIFTEIIHSTDPDALVCLALSSQRMHSVVKREIRRISKSLELDVIADVEQLAMIRFLNGVTEYNALSAKSITFSSEESNLISIRLGDQLVLASMGCTYLTTYWEDPVFGCRQVREFLSDLFNLDIAAIIFKRSSIWLLEWMRSLQKPVPLAVTFKDRMSEEDYQFLMSTCNADELVHGAIAPADFYPLEGFLPRTRLRIEHGSWLRIEHILRMDSVEIYVIESNLNSSHLNVLLKHWVSGGFGRLRVLMIRTEFTLVHDTILHQLDSKITRVHHEREYEMKNKWMIPLPVNTRDITRSDGKVVSVRIYEKHMTLFVWPDFSSA